MITKICSRLLGSFLTQTVILLVVILCAGVFAGCYPALHLSSQNAVKLTRQAGTVIARKTGVKSITVVLQYTVSIAMIICSIFLYKQLGYIRNNDRGFDRDNILIVPLQTEDIYRKHELLKAEFSNINAIEHISACYDYPGSGYTSNGYIPEGYKEPIMTHVLYTDEDFVPLMDLKMISGRNFSESLETDQSIYLINESYAQSIGWNDPIGKSIERNGKHEVIGVVSDFNFASLHEPVAPLIISLQPESRFHGLLIRIKEGELSHVVDQLRLKWEQIVPEVPFEISFLEDMDETGYLNEERQATLVLLFTILAILIAFMGLFALTSFDTERLTKQIGIRKVNGASAADILAMLLGRFTKWVLISILIACPLAFYFIHRWLQHFAYRTEMSWWVFVVAGVTAMILSLLTISWQTIRAALRNHVEALRYE